MAIIGREPPADIVIPMPQVSARHAEVQSIGSDRFSLVDLGSTNGTFVNGKRIESATVTFADRISLGQLEISLYSFRDQLVGIPQRSAPEERHAARSRQAQPLAVPSPPAPILSQQPQIAAASDGRYRENGMGTEVAAAVAANRSLVGSAFFTWILYWLFWVPGVIANVMYLGEAGRIKKLSGQSPSGTGCLWFLAVTHLLLPLVIVLFVVMTGGVLLARLRSLIP